MWILLIVLAVILILVIWLISAYNGLIRRRNQIENSWAQIDVQLKRRLDLIPNLVETVKADNQLTGALKSIFALGEAYPDLKANSNFLQLQEELTATEGRVAYARQFYNDSVLDYNNKLQQFPTVYYARALKFERREYFEADEAARTAPTVKF